MMGWIKIATIASILGIAFGSAAAPPSNTRTNVTGLWSGWHVCGNVKVGTSAMIAVDNSGNVDGIREFYPTPGDATRASGSFRLSGHYNPATGAIFLTAGDWINSPSGYLKCDFAGTVDPTGTTISGSAPGCSGCGDFQLTRQ